MHSNFFLPGSGEFTLQFYDKDGNLLKSTGGLKEAAQFMWRCQSEGRSFEKGK